MLSIQLVCIHPACGKIINRMVPLNEPIAVMKISRSLGIVGSPLPIVILLFIFSLLFPLLPGVTGSEGVDMDFLGGGDHDDDDDVCDGDHDGDDIGDDVDGDNGVGDSDVGDDGGDDGDCDVGDNDVDDDGGDDGDNDVGDNDVGDDDVGDDDGGDNGEGGDNDVDDDDGGDNDSSDIHTDGSDGTFTIVGGSRGEGAMLTVDDDGEADFTSIQRAIDGAAPGDTILISEGYYHESILIEKPLILRGNSTSSCRVDAMNSVFGVEILSDQVTILNLTIVNSGATVFENGAIRIHRSDNVTLSRVDVGNNLNGILVQNCSNITITDSLSHGNGQGIMIEDTVGILVRNCTITGNTINGILASDGENISIINSTIRDNLLNGIQIVQMNGTIIEGSHIHGNAQDGIFLQYLGVPIRITNNSVGNNRAHGIRVFLCDGGLIVRNVLESNIQSGITWASSSYYYQTQPFWSIINNSVSYNAIGLSLSVDDLIVTGNSILMNHIGVSIQSSSDGHIFRNNSMYDNQNAMIKSGSRDHRIDAINNWWGNLSGPYHHIKNPAGAGNPVSDHVSFEPWLGGNFSDRILNVDQDLLYPTLLEAVVHASENDTIRIPEGLYHEGGIIIDRSLTIIGAGPENTIFDGQSDGLVFIIDADNVSLSGLSIRYPGRERYISDVSGYYRYSSSGLLLLGDHTHVSDVDLSGGTYGGLEIYRSRGHVIKNVTVATNTYPGVQMSLSHDVLISNSSVTSHNTAISLSRSTNVTVRNSTLEGESGLQLSGSDSCIFSDNSMAGAAYDVLMEGSAYSIFRNNAFASSGITNTGSDLRNWTHDIDQSNTVAGTPVWYMRGAENVIIPEQTRSITLIDCRNITLPGGEFQGEALHYTVAFCQQIRLSNISILDCDLSLRSFQSDGFHLTGSTLSRNNGYLSMINTDNVTIAGNVFQNNTFSVSVQQGSNIKVEDNADGITSRFDLSLAYISNASILNNSLSRITVSSSNNIIFDGNMFFGGLDFPNGASNGIQIRNSNRVTINDTICWNTSTAIYLKDLHDVSITNSTLWNSSFCGIQISSCTRILIDQANLRDNYYGIRIEDDSMNITVINSTINGNSHGLYVYDFCQDVQVHNCSISGNRLFGIIADRNFVTVDARYNYWGGTNGPYHPDDNVPGTGDNVTRYVDYHPWLVEFGLAPLDDSDEGMSLLHILLVLLTILLAVLSFVTWYQKDAEHDRTSQPASPLGSGPSQGSASSPDSSPLPTSASDSPPPTPPAIPDERAHGSGTPPSHGWTRQSSGDEFRAQPASEPPYTGPRCTNCGCPVPLSETDRSIRIPCPECGMHLLTERFLPDDDHAPPG
jgi:hypothetical protein